MTKRVWKQVIKREMRVFPYVDRYDIQTIEKEFEAICPVIHEVLCKVEVPQVLHDEILLDFIPRWKEEKMKEPRFKMDGDQMVKRALTGFMGEAAIEALLGIPVLDRDDNGRLIVRDSRSFKTADLCKAGFNVGVKTVEWGKFPTIKRNVRRPQLVGFKLDDRTFLVGGFASMKTMRMFQSSSYVINENLRNKRTHDGQIEKTAFWGFHKLLKIRDLEGLKEIYYKKGV